MFPGKRIATGLQGSSKLPDLPKRRFRFSNEASNARDFKKISVAKSLDTRGQFVREITRDTRVFENQQGIFSYRIEAR